MPKLTIGYYAVRIGHKPGIYMNWDECKEQIHRYPGALYKKFYTKQQARNYINEENYDETDILKVWTDGYCENNGKTNALGSIGVFFDDNNPKNLSEKLPGEQQTNNRAELYATIRALEIVDNEQDMIVFTDSTYVINCCNVRNPKKNFDLVNRLNDLLKERKGKSIFKHVRGHTGIYGNKQADRLAYLGSKKSYVKEFNFPPRKLTIKDYFSQ
ncbi:40674_t:CDS:1 [Gigaspora margarita]|uniref:ribonuclease H n=1 Tax=Gigaspora margarita TaxID=4874 RepID=A0ABN7WQA4_GIGMA|nr:40674_t:CDS:1 [Gigaspora margarita]